MSAGLLLAHDFSNLIAYALVPACLAFIIYLMYIYVKVCDVLKKARHDYYDGLIHGYWLYLHLFSSGLCYSMLFLKAVLVEIFEQGLYLFHLTLFASSDLLAECR